MSDQDASAYWAQITADYEARITDLHSLLTNREAEIGRLREAVVMADNRLKAALLGDVVCEHCVKVAQSYLKEVLPALTSTECGDGK